MRARGAFFAVLCALMFAAASLRADGGAVCLRDNSGPFCVTVFVTPAALRVGSADMSVMVQDSATQDALLDEFVDIRLQPEAGGSIISLRATAEQSTNKLLQSAVVNFPSPGRWELTVSIRRGPDQAVLRTELQVAPPLPRFATIWPLLALPPVAALLFTGNQILRRRARLR